MTQKEYSIIATINEEGLNNRMWGMNSETADANSYYGCVASGRTQAIPPCIYIYCDDTATYGTEMKKLLYQKYDRKMLLDGDESGTQFICFFWLDPQTL